MIRLQAVSRHTKFGRAPACSATPTRCPPTHSSYAILLSEELSSLRSSPSLDIQLFEILVDLNDIDDYEEEPPNSFMCTVQAGANLVIIGRGRIGNNSVLYIPDATTNLMSTNSIVFNQCQIILGYDEEDEVFWCEIKCQKGRQAGMGDKMIIATNFNGLWWITQPEMLDILLRQGFTVKEVIEFNENLVAMESRCRSSFLTRLEEAHR